MKLRIFFLLILLLSSKMIIAQPNLYRTYTQTPVGNGLYLVCDMTIPVQSMDKGYIFGFNPWSPNIHSAYPIDKYIIKTDSNFIPQWRKPYLCNAIPLPTGGIILYFNFGTWDVNGFQDTYIEKITASGTQVWLKKINNVNIRINGGVQYTNKVRLVGGRLSQGGMYPQNYTITEPYTIELDTLGVVTSQQTFATSYPGFSEFGAIRRASSGDFYILGAYNGMVLAKFTSNFTFSWAKYNINASQALLLADVDILPNGRIIASGMGRGNSTFNGANMGTILKFDAQGNLLTQRFFDRLSTISGLCKKPNGTYGLTIKKGGYQDSLFIFEIDSSLNVSNFNLFKKGVGCGTPVLRNGGLNTMAFANHPILIGSSLSGSNCLSTPISPSTLNISATIGNYSLSPVTATFSVINFTYNVIMNQTYSDTCKCGTNNLTSNAMACAGNSIALQTSGIGAIKWFASNTSLNPLSTGWTYTYSSASPTVTTFFLQDSACVNFARTPVSVTVNPLPNVSSLSTSSIICAGASISMTASGAHSYSWSPFYTNGTLISPTISTTYSVAGTNTITGCKNNSTLAILVNPLPPVFISSSHYSICSGAMATLSALNADTYNWNTGSSLSSIAVSPSATSNYSVTGTNTLSGCANTGTYTLIVFPTPTVAPIASNSSVCLGATVALSGQGANFYVWSGGVQNGVGFSPTVTTHYTVTGTNTLTGCGDSGTITVIVNPLPLLSLNVTNTTVCQGSLVNLSASGASTYTWTNGITNGIAFAPASSSVYSVSGSSTNGCRSSGVSTVAVTVNPLPALTVVSSAGMICSGQTVTLTASGATTYSWNTGVITNQLIETPSLTVTYTVTGTDTNSCMNALSYTQWVSDCTSLNELNATEPIFLLYPNPAKSEFFVQINASVSLCIFNELGQLIKTLQVVESNKTYRISDLSKGVYLIRCTNVDGINRSKKIVVLE